MELIKVFNLDDRATPLIPDMDCSFATKTTGLRPLNEKIQARINLSNDI